MLLIKRQENGIPFLSRRQPILGPRHDSGAPLAIGGSFGWCLTQPFGAKKVQSDSNFNSSTQLGVLAEIVIFGSFNQAVCHSGPARAEPRGDSGSVTRLSASLSSRNPKRLTERPGQRPCSMVPAGGPHHAFASATTSSIKVGKTDTTIQLPFWQGKYEQLKEHFELPPFPSFIRSP